MKTLTSSLILAMLCGPALADPAAAQLKIAVSSGKTVRNYDMALVENSCGEVRREEATTRDEIKTCMHTENGKLRLDVEWNLREHDRDLHTKFVTLAAPHGKVEFVSDTAKLAISVQ